MSHKHPDDAPSVAALIEEVTRHGRPFSSRHRIIDTAGRVRVVVVVGDLIRDHDGNTSSARQGFYVDITHELRERPARRGRHRRRRHDGEPDRDRAGQDDPDARLRDYGRAGVRGVGLAVPGDEHQSARAGERSSSATCSPSRRSAPTLPVTSTSCCSPPIHGCVSRSTRTDRVRSVRARQRRSASSRRQPVRDPPGPRRHASPVPSTASVRQ